MTAVLTPVTAREVRVGDAVAGVSERRRVTNVTRGHNRQIYIVTVTAGGAAIVTEHDPGERVSVWREQP